MKIEIIGLDAKGYIWMPLSAAAKKVNPSKLHTKAKELLEEFYPYDTILEEVSLPGSKDQFGGKSLRADLFLPARRIIIEVHGEQHYKFNKFFFKNKLEFYKAKARDSDKREWCNMNEIELIELNFNEDIDEWREKIRRVSSDN
jgi:hypothetical protein